MGITLGGEKRHGYNQTAYSFYFSSTLSRQTHSETKWLTAAFIYCLGDQGYWWGLSAAPAHGLPRGAPPAHAGLLAEREGRPAKVWTDRQHAGQADPQPQHSEEDRRRDHCQVRGQDTDRNKNDRVWMLLKSPFTQIRKKNIFSHWPLTIYKVLVSICPIPVPSSCPSPCPIVSLDNPQNTLWTRFIETTFHWRNSPHKNC